MSKKKSRKDILVYDVPPELFQTVHEYSKSSTIHQSKTSVVIEALKQYFDNQRFKEEVKRMIERINTSNQDDESNHEFMDQIKAQVYEISKIKNELVMDQSMLLENRKLKFMLEIIYLVGLDQADLVKEYLNQEIEQRIAFEELREGGYVLDQEGTITLSDEAMRKASD